jgi:hypothetical protein
MKKKKRPVFGSCAIIHFIIHKCFHSKPYYHNRGGCGSIVVKALCYKLEGHRFQSQRSEWICSIYLSFQLHLALEFVYSASKRGGYQKQRNNVSGVKG